MPYFYGKVAEAIPLLEGLFSWDYLHSDKRQPLYWATVEALPLLPVYRKPTINGGKSDVRKCMWV